MIFALFLAAPIFAQTLNTVKSAVKDADIRIPLAEVTENAAFWPADVEGTRLEVIAVRAPDGTVRTAFNTCQSCYASGRGFYKQQGSVLVCQNCGKRFRMSQVEVRAGGCNPVPILASMKTVTDREIIISLELLKQAKAIFANWRRL
jgi:uncharacterized membrane protein